jgi:hypothetical protein
MASSMFMPSTREATPCEFPEHPPSNFTFVTLLSTTSKSIDREHTPVVLNFMIPPFLHSWDLKRNAGVQANCFRTENVQWFVSKHFHYNI